MLLFDLQLNATLYFKYPRPDVSFFLSSSCNKEEEQLAQQSVSIIELLNIVSNFLNAGFLASL